MKRRHVQVGAERKPLTQAPGEGERRFGVDLLGAEGFVAGWQAAAGQDRDGGT
jgi:hypothetical protein